MELGSVFRDFWWVLYLLVQVAFIVRVLLRPHRAPASRVAWIVVIAVFPVLGMIAYLMLGETNVGRAMADGMGSRKMIESEHWKAMDEAGVQLAVALPLGIPLLRILKGRIDLRNHRKIVVIDNILTYCGSQNCADPEFRVKPKFAPWIDALLRTR